MKLIISPYVSAGPIRLGTTRDEVRAILSTTPKEFQKGWSPIKTDAFDDWNLPIDALISRSR